MFDFSSYCYLYGFCRAELPNWIALFSVAISYNMADLLSSPDPLNDSPTFQSPPKTRRTSKARSSLQPRNSSPTKQTFELDVGNQISPQKIKVTVEAGSDTENGYTHFVEGAYATGTSPSRPRVNRRREKTTTTKVPVKGLSDSEEEATTPKRGRGRPRKSAGTPVPAKKAVRASTPTRKNGGRRKSIGDLVDGDDEEDYDFQIGKGVQVGRGKGRSRSRSIKESRKLTPATKEAEDRVISSTTSKKARGRRKSLLPEEVMVLEDEKSGGVPEPEEPELDTDGALQNIDGNEAYPPSAYSTIRSTTAVGANEPDIVIARFDPGNETPRRRGWSSPRTIEGARDSSPAFNGYPSPSVSPEKNASQCEESAAMIPVSPEHPQSSGGQSRDQEDQYDKEEEDGLGEMPEFDTVLESEGFSMISVDSVPSLREHLSSPADQAEKKPSNLVKKKNLASVKGLEVASQSDSFSSIPEDILHAATPLRRAQNSNLLCVQNSRIEDSFSSIPPGVLEAATPAPKTHVSKLQSRRDSQMEDSFSSISPEVLEAATPGRDLPNSKLFPPNNSQVYEDSFSAIPSAVLDAATPAPARQASPKPRTTQANPKFDKLSVPLLTRSTSSGRNSTNSTSTRLPTPEETPSPPADSSIHQAPGSEDHQSAVPAAASIDQLSANESSIRSQMRSSPPSVAPRRYTYTAHLRQRRELYPDITQTPSIVFSSPSLPPPIHVNRGQPVLAVQTEETQRPGLSPIARAGRALQDAVGPASSPRGRAQSLGSPFKSPVADKKSSSSVAPSNLSPGQERQTNQLSRLDVTGNLFPNLWNRSVHHDDPFSNNAPTHQQSIAPAQREAYTLGLPQQRRLSDPRLSTIMSEGNSVLSDDAMSWQAEEEITADEATTSLVNNINSSARERSSSVEPSHKNSASTTQTSEQKWAAERDAVSKQIENTSTSEVIFIDSDDEALGDAGLEEDDEDFGLLLETLNSSSPAVEQPQVLAKGNIEKPRRSKLPSPWRKNSKRLVYSDELSHLSSPPAPVRIPIGKNLVNKGISDEENAVELSSFIIPQKPAFQPRVRESGNLDLSALLASSPNKSRLPVLTMSSQNSTSMPPEPSFTSASSFRSGEDCSGGSQQQSFSPIPQKVGFQPRVRDARDVDTSSIFGSSPLKPSTYVSNIFGVHSNKGTVVHNPTPDLSSSSITEPLGLSSPSRTNSLHIPAQSNPAQLSESEYSYDSSVSQVSQEEKENRSIDNRTLKWTETVRLASAQMQPLVSPTKSCLRSPLKTPSNESGNGSNGANTSPSKNVAFVSSSPLPSSPTMEPLSSTTWSKDHWRLLDSILQSWKPENNGGSVDGPKGRRRNSTRVISRLLGKKVFSQGEEMRLLQWHLEVVDEFRDIVPGWQEKVIAMRLFACIVGEERRKAGVIGRRGGSDEVEQNA